MIKRYLNFINERLGVPEGNVESAQNIFDELVEFLSKNKNTELSKTSININEIRVSDMVIKNLTLLLDIVGEIQDDEDVRVSITSMGASYMHNKTGIDHIKFSKKNSEATISISIIKKKGVTFGDFLDFMKEDKAKNIGIISHEVKHLYDKFMLGKIMFSEIADYNSWSNIRFGISSIDYFIYSLYVISKAESLVRPSEIAGELIENNITKSEFKDFLESTSLYTDIKKMKEFSFEKMKSELYDDVDHIQKVLEDNQIEIPETPDEIVDLILELTYRNIVGKGINVLSDIMDMNPIRALLGRIKKEEKDYFQKYINRVTYKNKEDYFLYCEKLIIFEINKVFKKITKLYDMCADNEINKLHSKISNKSIKLESIVNPEMYDKYVAEKTIKNYDQFFKGPKTVENWVKFENDDDEPSGSDD